MENKSNDASKNNEAFLSTYGSLERKIYDIGESATIGRSSHNKIRISDSQVSLQHLRIDFTGQGFRLSDLQSTHGSFVNNTKVLSCYLQEGDRIQVGRQHLIFSYYKSRFDQYWQPLISRNKMWQRQLSKLPQISRSHFPVLITGPSGTGKERITQFIHRHSPRRGDPLINVNCSALSESLIESELFGHKKGSFTGADRDRKGAFQAARGGTLFLDEIGDLPETLQPKLLRALENHEVKPVGSDETHSTDVRIIAATHQNLKQRVVQKKFRADLFYRLNVLSIQMPALRDRLEDFDDLIYQLSKEFRVRLSHTAIEKLKEHPWPGNIRELRNAVARAQIMYGPSLIRDRDVKHLIDTTIMDRFDLHYERQAMKNIEKQAISDSLTYYRGNQTKVAQSLGIPKSTLYERIKAYGIDIDELLMDE